MSEVFEAQAIDLSYVLNKPSAEEVNKEKAKLIPKPQGYKILVSLPKIAKTFNGSTAGIVKADTTIYHEQLLTNVLWVVELGDMCYSDKERFPSGPWCKKGDFILCRANTGTRFKIYGEEFRLINDDSVEAVVQDPRAIERVN
jgi:co-chaperonin GroES (HSP10)